ASDGGDRRGDRGAAGVILVMLVFLTLRSARQRASRRARPGPPILRDAPSALLRMRRNRGPGEDASSSQPRPVGPGLLLEALDLGRLLHGEPDVVEAVEQAMLAVRIDVELHRAAVGPADLLLLEIDGERGVGAAIGIVEQLLQILGRDLDG